jgi:ribosomal protein S18 acetylase RimI-like enzyme
MAQTMQPRLTNKSVFMTSPTTQIRPMSEQEYNLWYQQILVEYAQEKAQVLEIDQDQALLLSQQSLEKTLPDGLKSADNHLFSISNEEKKVVGAIWFKVSTEWGVTTAFIYDLKIEAAHRRQGHAQAAMKLIEPEAKKHGASKMALHVFGFNKAAAKLYEKIGYSITDINMAKPI